MASALTLRSAYTQRERDRLEPVRGWYGTFDIELEIGEAASFPPGSQLALWCTMLLEPTEQSNARVVERLAGHLVVEPVDRAALDATAGSDDSARRWTISGVRSTFPARHANDGPERAYVILPSGDTIDVEVVPSTTTRVPRAGTIDDDPRESLDPSPAPPLVPFPVRLVAEGSARARRIELGDTSPVVLAEWATVRDLAQRCAVEAFDAFDAAIDDPLRVDASIDGSLVAESYRMAIDGSVATLVAGDHAGLRNALITLAQWAAAGVPERATIEDAPSFAARIVHLDLARRWYDPDVVARLIDLAAWRKFNRVHLHLTDDEAWRFPVENVPALAEVGGTRGHGLAIPALCASGAGRYGRSYTTDEIGAWVRRADRLGVVLVPEVDVPGHCHAALVAVPSLRDPDDTSTAPSVQGYLRNALIPGHPGTMPFLESVFGSLAALFPSSPWLHIGGDEVAHGGWDGSPIVAAYARRHGLSTQRSIETHFHRELVAMIRATTGRDAAMWEEAALAGLEPSGYAVAWTSVEAGHRLAVAGHDVVMAPGQAYYLDMAADRAWSSPGSSWAGIVPLETTCEFDPRAGWDPVAPGRLIGVQACIWGEHISGLDVLDQLTFPRLDAIAERGWTGHIVGGPASLRHRAAALPRFTDPPPPNPPRTQPEIARDRDAERHDPARFRGDRG